MAQLTAVVGRARRDLDHGDAQPRPARHGGAHLDGVARGDCRCRTHGAHESRAAFDAAESGWFKDGAYTWVRAAAGVTELKLSH